MRRETNVYFEVGANCPHFPKWSKMVQYGIKTDHLEHLGDHGPEMIQNGIEDDNPGQGYVSFNQSLRGVCVLQPTLLRGTPLNNPSEGLVEGLPNNGLHTEDTAPPGVGLCARLGKPSEGLVDGHEGLGRVG